METSTNQIKKPIAKVVGEDGNVFVTIAICHRALRAAGRREDAEKMRQEVMACGSYHEALNIMGEYCELT